MAILPALGAFAGGMVLPTSGLFQTLNLTSSGGAIALTLGCAVGAAIGDFLLHLFHKNLGSFRLTAMRMAMDGVYAGFFALVAVIGLGMFPDQISANTAQMVAAAVSGAGLYFMGRYGSIGGF